MQCQNTFFHYQVPLLPLRFRIHAPFSCTSDWITGTSLLLAFFFSLPQFPAYVPFCFLAIHRCFLSRVRPLPVRVSPCECVSFSPLLLGSSSLASAPAPESLPACPCASKRTSASPNGRASICVRFLTNACVPLHDFLALLRLLTPGSTCTSASLICCANNQLSTAQRCAPPLHARHPTPPLRTPRTALIFNARLCVFPCEHVPFSPSLFGSSSL